MPPYIMLMLAGLTASVVATPLKQATRSEVVAIERRGPLRRDQASTLPNPNPAPAPQCAGLGNFLIASIDPAGNFGYLAQTAASGEAYAANEQSGGTLFTVDADCRLSSVSQPGGVAGDANQLYDYTMAPTTAMPVSPFLASQSIQSGGAAIVCSTGGSDGFGNYFTCYNQFGNGKDVCLSASQNLYFSTAAPSGCTKVQLYYSAPQ